MRTKLDKNTGGSSFVAEATKKKIRSTLACTSSFLIFFAIIHSRGQRYVVPLTKIPNITIQNYGITVLGAIMICLFGHRRVN